MQYLKGFDETVQGKLITVLKLPGNNPDMHHIKQLWGILKQGFSNFFPLSTPES